MSPHVCAVAQYHNITCYRGSACMVASSRARLCFSRLACLRAACCVSCNSSGPDSLQFACNLLLMLPGQVAKLSRRKAANAVECCVAAASLAEVCQRWEPPMVAWTCDI